jgi:hypothetical protein
MVMDVTKDTLIGIASPRAGGADPYYNILEANQGASYLIYYKRNGYTATECVDKKMIVIKVTDYNSLIKLPMSIILAKPHDVIKIVYWGNEIAS